jgi:predicted amidohydrolase YtcJ
MMITQASPDETANIQVWLARDHERLDALFERLLSAFHANARSELCRLWAEFDSRLRAHLALEEEHILPEFAKVDPGEARSIAEEHVHIRRLLTELDIAVDLHLVGEQTVDALIKLLRAHARREDALMYRWAASHVEPAAQRTIIADFRRALAKLIGRE